MLEKLNRRLSISHLHLVAQGCNAMNTVNKYWPLVATPALLWASWPDKGFPLLALVAFVPLLSMFEHLSDVHMKKRRGLRVWFFCYLTFALFNLFVTSWIWNAHWSGVLAVCTFNAALMALVFLMAHKVRVVLGHKRGWIALVAFWLAFENFHQDWEMSWPWLTLGNAFAHYPQWVQWYEYTSVSGGTLWILIVNILIYNTLKKYLEKSEPFSKMAFRYIGIVLWVTLPIAFSLFRYNRYVDNPADSTEVVIVQPNFDAYTEKFDIPQTFQIQKFISLAETVMDMNTELVIGPETMLPELIEESAAGYHPDYQMLFAFKENYPRLNLLLGASTYQSYVDPAKVTPTARKYANAEAWFDVYNAAAYFSTDAQPEFYHKSKLVVGVEHFPFSTVLKPLLGRAVGDFGGTTGTHGIQKERTVFFHSVTGHGTSAIICFESVFPEFVSKFVRNGADFLCIITNDDWWGNTAGHRQHLHYARLRAVENRRWIARSANTGISAVINARGDILQSIPYKQEGALRAEIPILKEKTFFTSSGDIISRLAWFIGVFLALYTVAFRLRKKKL
ncbi:apolipoprotein N-acyltransferase [Schleiferia thermophila]|jgi:apolipoprotein N-acyltransferase|uniref:Apolipoprotein N-acyltransferase n=2 Tax=Schleiferia thermophila TaxID=884107 RepID=A0A369A6T1_9FLAO|nr:apolipoprotein N-acyltransferase [Fischerella thermalis CCMEE 5319]RCX03787.1 apolipoprotein N-acyltransferase [Schleiferia thermophila]